MNMSSDKFIISLIVCTWFVNIMRYFLKAILVWKSYLNKDYYDYDYDYDYYYNS